MDEESVSRDIIQKKNDEAKRLAKISRWFAAIAGAMTLGVTLYALFSGWTDSRLNSTLESTITSARVGELRAEMEILKGSLNKVEARISASSNASPVGVQISGIQADVKDFGERLTRLESTISTSPERALSVPLLRKDVDTLRDSMSAQASESARQIDRIYDQNKWFIGILFTGALAIISLVINSFTKSK